jgi:glutaredoxin
MYVIVGKQNCIECYELKNPLHEKGIEYTYSDITEISKKTIKLFENVL